MPDLTNLIEPSNLLFTNMASATAECLPTPTNTMESAATTTLGLLSSTTKWIVTTVAISYADILLNGIGGLAEALDTEEGQKNSDGKESNRYNK